MSKMPQLPQYHSLLSRTAQDALKDASIVTGSSGWPRVKAIESATELAKKLNPERYRRGG